MSPVDPTHDAERMPSATAEQPEADVQEQALAVDGWEEEEERNAGAGSPLDDRPEADVFEQSQVVAVAQVHTGSPRPDDASEADWLEQTVAEVLDEDER